MSRAAPTAPARAERAPPTDLPGCVSACAAAGLGLSGNVHGKDGESTSSDNSTSPREGGTSEVHRPQLASERSKRTPASGSQPQPPHPHGED
jgi:hypothetical protein